MSEKIIFKAPLFFSCPTQSERRMAMAYRRSYKSYSIRGNASRKVAAYTNAAGTRARITAAGRGLIRTGGNAPFTRGRRTRYSRRTEERKYMEINIGDTVAPTGGVYLTSLGSLVSQGTGECQRIGRKFTIRSVSLTGEIKMPNKPNTLVGNADYQFDNVRVMVVQDKQANGTVPNLNDIFSVNAGVGGAGSVDLRAFRTMDNIQRFRILHDKIYNVANMVFTNGTGTAAQSCVNFKVYKKCYIPMEMSDTSASTANARSNNIHVYAVSTNGYAGVNFIARIRFSDEG